MKSPTTYGEWSMLLEQLKRGTHDEEIMRAMESGTITWSAGVAERFTRLVIETMEHRLRGVVDSFQKELNRAAGSETAIILALNTARRRFSFINRLCELPVFPKLVKLSVKNLFNQYIQDTQAGLEQSAQADRTGRLRLLFKNNPLTNLELAEPKARKSRWRWGRKKDPQSSQDEVKPLNSANPARRRVLL